MWTIYGHQNKINGKWYIGQTKRPVKVRWGKNGSGYRGSRFYKAIEKYGWDNFNHILLKENIASQDEADKIEKLYINKYDCQKNGYNIKNGGISEGWFHEFSPVYQLDENKNILNAFKSIQQAENDLHICNISGCCRQKQKTAGGYYWCYQEDYEFYKILKPLTSPRKESVLMLDENKNIIEKFSSISNACKKYDLNHANIISCCLGKRRICNGYYWCYEHDYNIYTIKSKKIEIKKILQFNLNLNLIKEWDSAREIESNLGFAHSAILDNCKQKCKQAYGYIWKFKEV